MARKYFQITFNNGTLQSIPISVSGVIDDCMKEGHMEWPLAHTVLFQARIGYEETMLDVVLLSELFHRFGYPNTLTRYYSDMVTPIRDGSRNSTGDLAAAAKILADQLARLLWQRRPDSERRAILVSGDLPVLPSAAFWLGTGEGVWTEGPYNSLAEAEADAIKRYPQGAVVFIGQEQSFDPATWAFPLQSAELLERAIARANAEVGPVAESWLASVKPQQVDGLTESLRQTFRRWLILNSQWPSFVPIQRVKNILVGETGIKKVEFTLRADGRWLLDRGNESWPAGSDYQLAERIMQRLNHETGAFELFINNGNLVGVFDRDPEVLIPNAIVADSYM